jgi:hypothetical protein
MLVRIKFTLDRSNRLTKEELDRLSNFLGEQVEARQLKIGENGEPETLSWDETFDEEKVKRDSDYKLVQPSGIYQISDSNNYIVDLNKFTSMFPNLEFTIRGVPKSVSNDYLYLIEHMEKIAAKIEEAKNRFDKVVEFNQKCYVHVPNLGLLNINRVAYATDYCTEELQKLLHQGWRIIAVCPQPDQRRPDYILGMHVNELGDDVEVKHFEGSGREGYLKEKDKNKLS